MRRRTERRIGELMGVNDERDSDSEEEVSGAEPVEQGMGRIGLLEFVVYGLLWFLVVPSSLLYCDTQLSDRGRSAS